MNWLQVLKRTAKRVNSKTHTRGLDLLTSVFLYLYCVPPYRHKIVSSVRFYTAIKFVFPSSSRESPQVWNSYFWKYSRTRDAFDRCIISALIIYPLTLAYSFSYQPLPHICRLPPFYIIERYKWNKSQLYLILKCTFLCRCYLPAGNGYQLTVR